MRWGGQVLARPCQLKSKGQVLIQAPGLPLLANDLRMASKTQHDVHQEVSHMTRGSCNNPGATLHGLL
jgi:hypothetical protein